MERLTAKRAETLRKPGRYHAGDTVYLVVAKGRTGRVNKRWVQRLHVQGKRRDISIGTYPAVTLSEARERAHDNRLTAKRGGDPSGRVSTVPTFAAVSAQVDQGSQWRRRTRETRRRTLARYAARLMARPVDQIDRAAVLSVLGPVYRDKPATGKLLRGWVRGVLAAAQALGHVDVNAAGEVNDPALPKTPKTREHRRALPYADVPAALEAVEASGSGPAVKAAIRFTALTAVRSGEARGATWGEVDLEAREWRVPASRMKAGAEHRVPLSDWKWRPEKGPLWPREKGPPRIRREESGPAVPREFPLRDRLPSVRESGPSLESNNNYDLWALVGRPFCGLSKSRWARVSASTATSASTGRPPLSLRRSSARRGGSRRALNAFPARRTRAPGSASRPGGGNCCPTFAGPSRGARSGR